MTTKDYRLIAATLDSLPLGTTKNTLTTPQYLLVCERMANALQADNPRFDRALFLRACGVSA